MFYYFVLKYYVLFPKFLLLKNNKLRFRRNAKIVSIFPSEKNLFEFIKNITLYAHKS